MDAGVVADRAKYERSAGSTRPTSRSRATSLGFEAEVKFFREVHPAAAGRGESNHGPIAPSLFYPAHMRRGAGGQFGRAVALALVVFLVPGCAATRSATRTVGGWLGIVESAPPRAYYAGVARAKLYREADASSDVVGEVARYEGVLCYEVEGAFCHVKVDRTGAAGWMRREDLIDRPPQAAQPKPVAAPPAAAPAETAAEPAAEPEPAPESPEPPPAPPEKSVFDPY